MDILKAVVAQPRSMRSSPHAANPHGKAQARREISRDHKVVSVEMVSSTRTKVAVGSILRGATTIYRSMVMLC